MVLIEKWGIQGLSPDLHASLPFAHTAAIAMPPVQEICLQINAKSHCKLQVEFP